MKMGHNKRSYKKRLTHAEHVPVTLRWETHASSDSDRCRSADGQIRGEDNSELRE